MRRSRSIKDVPLFPLVPIVPIAALVAALATSIRALIRVRRLEGRLSAPAT
jgi:hypothetical protein